MGAEIHISHLGGHHVGACLVKGRSASECESRPGKPPEGPGSQPPAFGEIRALKRGEAKLQAVAIANSAASIVPPSEGSSGPSLAQRGEGSSPGRSRP